MTKVNALMTGNVVTIDPDASGHDAVSLMVATRSATCRWWTAPACRAAS